ncbi:MAG: hypothetical protein EZS28_026396, partial [Streblomastix strix]
MDFANFGSLERIIEKKANLSIPIVRTIMKQLLQGLNILHKNGLLCHNIKGQNVLLHSPLGSGRVIIKITDYNIFKSQSSQQDKSNMPVIGENPYQAPELFIPNQDGQIIADGKADIWSAAILLYKLVTHEFPFKYTNQQEAIDAIIISKLDRHPSIGQDKALLNLLTKMLEFEPEDRFSAEKALSHTFFTGRQAIRDVSEEAKNLTLKLQSEQKGNKDISEFEKDSTYTIPIKDLIDVVGVNPEQEDVRIRSRIGEKVNIQSQKESKNENISKIQNTQQIDDENNIRERIRKRLSYNIPQKEADKSKQPEFTSPISTLTSTTPTSQINQTNDKPTGTHNRASLGSIPSQETAPHRWRRSDRTRRSSLVGVNSEQKLKMQALQTQIPQTTDSVNKTVFSQTLKPIKDVNMSQSGFQTERPKFQSHLSADKQQLQIQSSETEKPVLNTKSDVQIPPKQIEPIRTTKQIEPIKSPIHRFAQFSPKSNDTDTDRLNQLSPKPSQIRSRNGRKSQPPSISHKDASQQEQSKSHTNSSSSS